MTGQVGGMVAQIGEMTVQVGGMVAQVGKLTAQAGGITAQDDELIAQVGKMIARCGELNAHVGKTRPNHRGMIARDAKWTARVARNVRPRIGLSGKVAGALVLPLAGREEKCEIAGDECYRQQILDQPSAR